MIMVRSPTHCLMLSLSMVFMLTACSRGVTPSSSPGVVANSPSSLPLRATVNLGVVVQRQSAELNSWITNKGKSSVRVYKSESSCECLEARLSQMRIAPGERALVHVRYDGAREPEFVGSLQIEVRLVDDTGSTVGQIDVPIEVIRAAEDPD